MARLRHFAVVVSDLEKADKFYEGVFELKRVGRDDLEFAFGILSMRGLSIGSLGRYMSPIVSLWSIQMAKMNLSSMSVQALLQLRDDIGSILSGKVIELQRQLAALSEDMGAGGGRRGRRGSAMKRQKVVPKYRGPDGETWAGRGAMPRWMAGAIKEGKTREDFLIDKSAAASKPGRSVKKRRKK